jgi:TRAP-type C4-dicarboxylate transport system permease small subunit
MTGVQGNRQKPETRICAAIARATAALAAAGLVALMVFQLVAISARYFLDSPIEGAQDVMAFLLGAVIFSAIPMVTWQGTHILVPIIAERFTGRFRFATRLLVMTGTCGAFTIIGVALFKRARTAYLHGIETADLTWPLAPMLAFMAVMAVLSALLLTERIWTYGRTGWDGTSKSAPNPPLDRR